MEPFRPESIGVLGGRQNFPRLDRGDTGVREVREHRRHTGVYRNGCEKFACLGNDRSRHEHQIGHAAHSGDDGQTTYRKHARDGSCVVDRKRDHDKAVRGALWREEFAGVRQSHAIEKGQHQARRDFRAPFGGVEEPIDHDLEHLHEMDEDEPIDCFAREFVDGQQRVVRPVNLIVMGRCG